MVDQIIRILKEIVAGEQCSPFAKQFTQETCPISAEVIEIRPIWKQQSYTLKPAWDAEEWRERIR
jgi:hypothetical protein